MTKRLQAPLPDRRRLAAEEAAFQVFHAEPGDLLPEWAPESVEEARAAVDRLGELFHGLPGSIRRALTAARGSGEVLSSDRLQGIKEVVQNADDLMAREVQVLLRETELLLAHDGQPVELHHVLALATPWLTTKADNALATGRFGIGLMTLQSLSSVLDVHCGPYHVRVGSPDVASIEPIKLPRAFAGRGWTVLRVPLEPGTLGQEELAEWLGRWDVSALLFCGAVRKMSLVGKDGTIRLGLELSWEDAPPPADFRLASAGDGRSWRVYSREVSSPPNARRAHKATNDTTPIGVALALHPDEHGELYAGLPVAETMLPVRINAQFDPLTNRQALVGTHWNSALIPLITDLWVDAVSDLFDRDPAAGWRAVPLPDNAGVGRGPADFVLRVDEALLAAARTDLSARLAFNVLGLGKLSLSSLAVEEFGLEGILTEAEIAALGGTAAALPSNVRDREGRWRLVLDDWREAAADVGPEVGFLDALPLLEDDRRSVDATIALCGAAIDNGWAPYLAFYRCVITNEGHRINPPTTESADVLVAGFSPLADALGLGSRLHPRYLADEEPSSTVIRWLRELGALLDDEDDLSVVRRLAAAGRSGHRLERPLTDEQAKALREAFESMPPTERGELGRGLGAAVLLDGYHYLGGKKVAVSVRPSEAYLPKTIDREPDGFAAAAETTEGLSWVATRYAEVLRSVAGRGGLGALRFLRLLGAETAPRLQRHPSSERKYASEWRLGVPSWAGSAAAHRWQTLRALGAEYTLEDYHSPDLQAVLNDIAADRSARRRRGRAAAIIGTLGRAWDRMAEHAEVTAAQAYYGWNAKGHVRGLWLFDAGDTTWLDDSSGTPQAPAALRLRTPATVAVWGPSTEGYLHKDLDAPNRRELLSALGVTGDPNMSELVDRLYDLRAAEGKTTRALTTETGIVYQALAQRISSSGRGSGDLSLDRLRAVFAEGTGLVWTRGAWRKPAQLLGGPPIFGTRRDFVPQVPRTERLWRALRIGAPALGDCIDVLMEVAQGGRPSAATQAVLLETLRLLAAQLAGAEVHPQTKRRLSRLPLWTSAGWASERPVYAIDDPGLAEALGELVPIWNPGAEISQFSALLPLLKVGELDADRTTVLDPGAAVADEEATARTHSAVVALRDDLTRNEPDLARSLQGGWDVLAALEVRIHPALAITVEGLPLDNAPALPATAKVDTVTGVLYAAAVEALPRVDGGGRAIAALFSGNRRRVAQAWRAAWDLTDAGRVPEALAFSEDEARREADETQADIEARSAAFQEETSARHTGARQRQPRPKGQPMPATSTPDSSDSGSNDDLGAAPSGGASPRVLVDPAALRLRDAAGRLVGGGSRNGDTGREPSTKGGVRPRLVEPRPGNGAPRQQTPPAGYTGTSRETVGLDLVRIVLAGDDDRIEDIRNQRNVGADAVDDLRRFYELKVYAGSEPDRITLTPSELERALTTPDFFLVVVSGVEQSGGTPTVRFILDPLRQLHFLESGGVTLGGVRDSLSVVYEFDPEPTAG